MAVITPATAKSYLEEGDYPTEAQFAAIIDSLPFKPNDNAIPFWEGGNDVSANKTMGLIGNYALDFMTNNIVRDRLHANGRRTFGGTTDNGIDFDIIGTFAARSASVIGTAPYTPNDNGNVAYTTKSRTGIYVANAGNNFGISYEGGRIYANIGYGASNPAFTPSVANWNSNVNVIAPSATLNNQLALLIRYNGGVIRSSAQDRAMLLRGGEDTDNPTMTFYGKSHATYPGIIAISYGVLKIGNIHIISGTGSPEGVVTAPLGSVYYNDAGGTGTSEYVKETAPTGSTGWVAK